MKIRISFNIVLLLSLTLGCKAQANLLDEKITLEEKGKTVVEILEKIETITQLRIAYPSSLISNPDEKKNISWKNKSLKECIESLFAPQKVELKVIGESLLIKSPKKEKTKSTLQGWIKDKSNGEFLIGATILIKELENTGVISNEYGFYTLALEAGKYTIEITYIGYENATIEVELKTDQRLDINLSPGETVFQEVVIKENKWKPTTYSNGTSRYVISTKAIKTLPNIGGEPDVLKTIHTLPGVVTVGEGSSAMYIRGGNQDQNLILLDEAPIYNPSHLLGFFSIFHPDAIHHTEVHKGNFPVKYGGRLSSVVDMKMKEGNKEAFGLEGGIGLLSSRLMMEGPIKKGKHSF
ncbi:MAG: TonB-dependent receptor, partial [Bacteroidota bacterium]